MKREEIEHLLVEYINGEISAADTEELEELFKNDPNLKQEAEDMAKVWASMEKTERNTKSFHRMDTQFYSMLDGSKNVGKTTNNRSVITKWLKPAIAAAACVAMFLIGRISVAPEQITKYKTVYIKAPVSTGKTAIVPDQNLAVNTNKYLKTSAKLKENEVNPLLAQQLRSVYASERIAAIMELSKSENLNSESLKMLGLALREDPNPNVRLMVINSLQPLSSQENVQAVLVSGLNHQDDQLIQTSIIDLLVEAKSKMALPQLIVLLKNNTTNTMIQHKIQDGIETFLY
jgi:hypothetical protein